jgi:hypothetical protein
MIRVEEKKALVLSNSPEVFLFGKKMMGKFQHLFWGKFHGR